jgi:hypothetical protein
MQGNNMVDAIYAFDAGLKLDPGNKDIVANRDAALLRMEENRRRGTAAAQAEAARMGGRGRARRPAKQAELSDESD